MIAVILVGGEGTRLRPLTLDRPKAMLPIAGRPFLAHMLERLAAAGVQRVIFSCGYLPDPIVAGFGDELGRFEDLIRSISAVDWKKPSRCLTPMD